MRQVIVALFLMVGAVTAAPAPLPQHDRLCPFDPSVPYAGKYTVSWQDSIEKPGELFKDGTGWYMYYTTKYYFVWEWEPSSRTFTMWETSNEQLGELLVHTKDKQSLCQYTFRQLDYQLSTRNNHTGTKLRLTRNR